MERANTIYLSSFGVYLPSGPGASIAIDAEPVPTRQPASVVLSEILGQMAVPTGMRVFGLLFATLVCVMLPRQELGAAQAGSASKPSTAAAGDPASSEAAELSPAGQAPSGEAARAFPLRAVNIAGNDHFAAEDIIWVTGLEIGARVAPSEFQRAMRKLRNSGAFESLEFRYGPEGDGYQVTFTVQEVPEVYPVTFRGFGVADEQLHALLKEKIPLYDKRVPPTGPLVNMIGNALQGFWAKQGNDSKIVGTLAPAIEDEFEMVFQPPSAIKTIAFVTFEDSGDITPLDLQRHFNQSAMGVPFSQPRLLELLHHNVRPLYEEKGRLGVTFCPCSNEPDTETQGILVNVHVDQGPLYVFRETRFHEGVNFESSELSRRVKFHEGETANMKLVNESLAEMEKLLKAAGYLRVFGRYDREVNDAAKTVDIVLDIRRGDLYTFNELTITGLDIVGEAAVKKRWDMKPGDPFNANYPKVFLSRVQRMFDNLSKTDSKTKIDEETKKVDVELLFE